MLNMMMLVNIIIIASSFDEVHVVGTIAFYVTLPPETIPVDTTIVFQTVNLNIGNG